MKFSALFAASFALAALVSIVSSSAFATTIALDATETLSDFKIEADSQETPTQIFITNMRMSYTSSKRGPLSDPLRLDGEHTTVGATAVCLNFGATKLVDYRGSAGFGRSRVLYVDLVKGKTAFNWLMASETYLPAEIVCEK